MTVVDASSPGGARQALAARGWTRPPIVVMDSGVGGLSYLEPIHMLLPGEPIVYLADRAGFPYGKKTREEIEAIVLDRIRRLVQAFRPRAVVIACNTASQAALAAARAAHPGLPIVGTVPAVKPAVERTRSGIIAVMATEHAIHDPYLDDLIARHASGTTVLRVEAQDLVSFVELDFIHSDAAARRIAIEPFVKPLLEAGVDEIVLACTHFLHVAPDIESLAASVVPPGRTVEVIDSREGVARRLRDVLGMAPSGPSNPRSPTDGAPFGVFLLSGSAPFESGYGDFAERCRLEGPFPLEGA